MIEKDVKAQTFRLNTESTEKFRRFCEENGVSQADGFDVLIKLAELEKAKTIIPDRKAEIENVQTHANALVAAYLHSIDIYTSAADRAQADVSEKITKKEKRIAELEDEKEAIKASLYEKNEKIVSLENYLNEREKQFETMSVTHQNALNSLKDKDKIIFNRS